MNLRYIKLVFLVLLLVLCSLTCSQKQVVVAKNYEQAYNNQDIQSVTNLFTDDAVFEFGNQLALQNKNRIQEFIDYFIVLNSHIHLSNFKMESDTLYCDLAESNDWLIRSGLGKALYSARFEFHNNLIKNIQIKATLETEKDLKKILDLLIDWASIQKPQKLAEIMSNGKFIYTGKSAKTSLSLLQDWIDATQVKDQNNISKFEKIMNAIGVKPGMIIGEAGAGEGYHAVNFSKRVGKAGKIYANEIKRNLLRKMKKRFKEKGITNVITVLGEQTDARFPRDDLDMVYMRHVLHCMRKPAPWLKNVKKYMKPNASLVIIDGDPDILGFGWKYEIKREEVIRMAEEAGFKLARLETFLLPEDYIYIFHLK
jgi:SAM-dependent methyltransferase